MHCTVAFLDEYPLPDSFELKAFMLALVCLKTNLLTTAQLLPTFTVFGLKTLYQRATLETHPLYYLNKTFYALPLLGVR